MAFLYNLGSFSRAVFDENDFARFKLTKSRSFDSSSYAVFSAFRHVRP